MMIEDKIKEQITKNPVVLYMKGTMDMPKCGFSAKAVQCLKAAGQENFLTVDVLEDPEIRQGIKDYSDWPTIPQLYVRGEFIGGCDIITEMFSSGELTALLSGE